MEQFVTYVGVVEKSTTHFGILQQCIIETGDFWKFRGCKSHHLQLKEFQFNERL